MNASQRNIFLIGYRATGKTTVGKILADRLSFSFLDMDRVIEERVGKSVREMVSEFGWDFFRTKECELLEELLKQEGLVVATGGGTILQRSLWPRVMDKGFVAWLFLDPERICERMSRDPKTVDQRPALHTSNIYSEVRDVLSDREELYRQGCHFQVDANQSAETIVEFIEEHCIESRQKLYTTDK